MRHTEININVPYSDDAHKGSYQASPVSKYIGRKSRLSVASAKTQRFIGMQGDTDAMLDDNTNKRPLSPVFTEQRFSERSRGLRTLIKSRRKARD